MNTPIKRDPALQPFSRDHHYGLLLCWKIKTGFAKGIPTERIKAYSDWFYEHHLISHFEIEEKYVFPVLGNENELVTQALNEHKKLIKLFSDTNSVKNSLKHIQTALDDHIRFEERILYNEIQNTATSHQLEIIKKYHLDTKFADNLSDQFWL